MTLHKKRMKIWQNGRIPQIEGPKEEGKSYNFRNKKNQHPDFWQMYTKFNLSKGLTRAADQTPNNVQKTPPKPGYEGMWWYVKFAAC